MKPIALVLILNFVFILTGCAHVYHIQVNAINGGKDLSKPTYVIYPGNSNTQANDLQFKEYAQYLDKALKNKGYIPATSNHPPDMQVFLSYGIGNPKTRVRTYTVPVWGQTGTTITSHEETFKTKDGNSNTVTTTNVDPEYGITGYGTEEQNYTIYPKYVEIDAYEADPAKPESQPEEIWKTTVRGEGRRSDLRHAFPIFIAAASKYLGGNTHQEILVHLTEDSDEVRMIKSSDN